MFPVRGHVTGVEVHRPAGRRLSDSVADAVFPVLWVTCTVTHRLGAMRGGGTVRHGKGGYGIFVKGRRRETALLPGCMVPPSSRFTPPELFSGSGHAGSRADGRLSRSSA